MTGTVDDDERPGDFGSDPTTAQCALEGFEADDLRFVPHSMARAVAFANQVARREGIPCPVDFGEHAEWRHASVTFRDGSTLSVVAKPARYEAYASGMVTPAKFPEEDLERLVETCVARSKAAVRFDQAALLRLQRLRHALDVETAQDVLFLPRIVRLKKVGLTYAALVGRMATGMSAEAAATEAVLACLRAANALNQRLGTPRLPWLDGRSDALRGLAAPAGSFCDACEKSDHLEPFVELAHRSNAEVLGWAVATSAAEEFDLLTALEDRLRPDGR